MSVILRKQSLKVGNNLSNFKSFCQSQTKAEALQEKLKNPRLRDDYLLQQENLALAKKRKIFDSPKLLLDRIKDRLPYNKDEFDTDDFLKWILMVGAPGVPYSSPDFREYDLKNKRWLSLESRGMSYIHTDALKRHVSGSRIFGVHKTGKVTCCVIIKIVKDPFGDITNQVLQRIHRDNRLNRDKPDSINRPSMMTLQTMGHTHEKNRDQDVGYRLYYYFNEYIDTPTIQATFNFLLGSIMEEFPGKISILPDKKAGPNPLPFNIDNYLLPNSRTVSGVRASEYMGQYEKIRKSIEEFVIHETFDSIIPCVIKSPPKGINPGQMGIYKEFIDRYLTEESQKEDIQLSLGDPRFRRGAPPIIKKEPKITHWVPGTEHPIMKRFVFVPKVVEMGSLSDDMRAVGDRPRIINKKPQLTVLPQKRVKMTRFRETDIEKHIIDFSDKRFESIGTRPTQELLCQVEKFILKSPLYKEYNDDKSTTSEIRDKINAISSCLKFFIAMLDALANHKGKSRIYWIPVSFLRKLVGNSRYAAPFLKLFVPLFTERIYTYSHGNHNNKCNGFSLDRFEQVLEYIMTLNVQDWNIKESMTFDQTTKKHQTDLIADNFERFTPVKKYVSHTYRMFRIHKNNKRSKKIRGKLNIYIASFRNWYKIKLNQDPPLALAS